jgi:hypothetical protein
VRRVFLALLVAGCSGESKVIDLTFGGGTRSGLRCTDDTGNFLIARAIDPGRILRFSVLVDFIGIGGVPMCRPGDILEFCQTRDCAPLPVPERLCIDLEARSIPLGGNVIDVATEMLRTLDGHLITADAPRTPVIIRAVATAQRCADVPGVTALDPDQLIGCAWSCPAQLDAVEGEVVLDLPAFGDRCAASVVFCATGNLSP